VASRTPAGSAGGPTSTNRLYAILRYVHVGCSERKRASVSGAWLITRSTMPSASIASARPLPAAWTLIVISGTCGSSASSNPEFCTLVVVAMSRDSGGREHASSRIETMSVALTQYDTRPPQGLVAVTIE
jgi:hypothetical protein